MSPTVYEEQILIVVDWTFKNITNRVVIVTYLWQCLSHRHDIDTAHNNTCSFYITRT